MPRRKGSRKLPDPVARLLVLLAIIVGAIVYVYHFIVPQTYKDPNFQVASVIERETSREPKYAGASACVPCHEKEHNVKEAGYHRQVSCETCHGAARTHTEDPAGVRPPAPRDRRFCPTCHAYEYSKPAGFPQINPVTHNPLEPCIECHAPHDPRPPKAPTECEACHADVERTKALSHHARLECTTCHSTPEAHRTTPRLVKPEKPRDRAFCGICHGLGSTIPGAPKVDLETHEPKYTCWQCHYPHMPEVD